MLASDDPAPPEREVPRTPRDWSVDTAAFILAETQLSTARGGVVVAGGDLAQVVVDDEIGGSRLEQSRSLSSDCLLGHNSKYQPAPRVSAQLVGCNPNPHLTLF